MPEVRLDRARVVAIVGELVAAGVAEHVGLHLDAQSDAVLPARRPLTPNKSFGEIAPSQHPHNEQKMGGPMTAS